MAFSSPTSDVPITWHQCLKRQIDVVGALILRDLHTRFDRVGMYALAVLWPLAHIVIVVMVYKTLGAHVWLGTDPTLFFALGVLPFILFTYPCRNVARSISDNRVLLSIPRVHPVDLIISRVVLECITAFAIAFVFIGALLLTGSSFDPFDPLSLIGALSGALLLGVGFGVTASVIAAINPRTVGMILLFNILLYAMSGLVFLPGNLPSTLREGLAWNPLLHAVEWVREAYFGDYQSVVLSKSYLLAVGFALLLGGLIAERLLKRRILGG